MFKKWFHPKPSRGSAHSGGRGGPPSKPSGSPVEQIRQRLHSCDDVNVQRIALESGVVCHLIFIESITDTKRIQDFIVRPLLEDCLRDGERELIRRIADGAVIPIQATAASGPEEAVRLVLDGNAALVVDDRWPAFLFPITSYKGRSVPEATNEMVIIGPQEAFVENIQTNLSLIRHKLKHPDFKTLKFEIGEYTQTSIYVVYIHRLVDTEVLDTVMRELDSIRTDSVIGVSYIAELMNGQPFSPFPTIQYTERPDTLAASILEGRIGIMVDGTPQALLAPVTFFSQMQSPEDYFQNYISATWIRWVRYFFAIASFLIPSFYLAITTFHPEMIPATLLVTISAARENVPFPLMVEVLIMEMTFEALREAGIRIPRPLGQTVSIIGAIVIGQATVQAGIVSAPTVIVVSITGIASFVIPHFELGLAFRLLRFPLLLLGGTFGLFGIILGLFVMFWHMTMLKSFGVPFMHPIAPFVLKDWKDVLIRTRWSLMNRRPDSYGSESKRRQEVSDDP